MKATCIMHDAQQGRMGRLKKILSGLSDIDSLVVNTFFTQTVAVVIYLIVVILYACTFS